MDVEFLLTTILFKGMTVQELEDGLRQLRARECDFKKGEILLHAGDMTDRLGLVLSGSVTIESNDMWGNRTILGMIDKGEYFAETYALLRNEPLLVDVCASEDSRIMFLYTDGLVRDHETMPLWQQKLIYNLLLISVHKNLMLSNRIFHTSPKTVRGRIMAYLNSVSLKKNGRTFDIPFNRQQMADYLNLDRTALSKELGKMKKAGILEFRKNHFVLR